MPNMGFYAGAPSLASGVTGTPTAALPAVSAALVPAVPFMPGAFNSAVASAPAIAGALSTPAAISGVLT